ncbi:hypothetical protein ACJMK2_029108, partial [Sinanodonta woodiana]
FWLDGGNATNFRIAVDGDTRAVNISKTESCPNVSQDCNRVIDGLSPGTKYNITIFAISNGIENSQSCSLYGISLPNSPLCSNVTNLSNTSLKAFWLDGGNATNFRIAVNGDTRAVNISKTESCPNVSQDCNRLIDGLSPGTKYNITIFAISNGNENSQSCTLYGNSLPNSPLCSNVTTLSNTSLKAFWLDGGNATNFRIAVDGDTRTVNINKTESCPNVSQDCNRMIDGLSPGTKYNITIFAISNGNENSQSCRLFGNSLPNSPLCSNVTTLSNTSLKAFWLDGGNATNFRIAVDGDTRAVNISKTESCQNVSQDCNRVIDGLSPGTKYNITIFAISNGNENSQSCTLFGNSLPNSPLCSNVTTLSNTSLKAFWLDGGNATNFRIAVDGDTRTVNINKTESCPNVSQDCNRVIDGLSPGTKYNITLFAISNGNENSQSCRLYGNTLPNSPLCSNVTTLSNTSLKAFWLDGGNATNFRIAVDGDTRTVNINKTESCPNVSQDCNRVIDGLSPGTKYNITIFAISNGIENSQSCRLYGNSLPNSPLCSNVTTLSNTSLKAFWLDGGNATNFRIAVDGDTRTVNINKTESCPNGSQDCNRVIDGLSPGTKYNITIFAISNGIENSQSCRLYGNSLPNSPLCSNVTTLSNTSLKAFWLDGGNATNFRIAVDGDTRAVNIRKTESCPNVSQDCNRVIDGLSPGTKYNITIFAISNGNENSQSCRLYGNSLPNSPLCSNVTTLSNTSLKAFWLDGGNATNFRIAVDGDTRAVKINKTESCPNVSQDCNRVIDGLSPGTKYNITIFAISNGNENSQPCSLYGNSLPNSPLCSNVTTLSNTSLKAFWFDGGNATNFRIAVDGDTRTVNINKTESCPNVSQDCNRVIDGLFPGTKYNITIFAISNGNENSQSCRLFGNSLPNSPLCSNVTTLSNTSLKAFWLDGGNATNFRIAVDGDTRAVNINKTESCPNVSQDCNRVIDGLSPGTKYNITIFAISNGNENSQPCSLYGNSLPNSPLCSNVTTLSNTSLKAFWFDGGNATNFRIAVDGDTRTVNINKTESCPNVSQDCNRVIDGLFPGTKYNITIFAISNGNENSQSCRLFGNSLPNSPLCSNVTTLSNTSLKAFWLDGGNATNFRIAVDGDTRAVNINKTESCPNVSQDCNRVIDGLSPGTKYNITIFAISNGNENSQSCRLYGNSLPNSPLCSNVTTLSNTSLKAFWLDGGNATNFRIAVDGDTRAVNINKTESCPNVSQDCNRVIDGLSPGTKYNITIFAISYGNENSQSCRLYVNTLPNSPLCSNVTTLSNTSLRAFWLDGGNATNFRIAVDGDTRAVNINKTESCPNVSQDCNRVIDGLSPGTKYNITIFAISNGNENSQSCTLYGNSLPNSPLCSDVTTLSNTSLKAFWLDGGNATNFRIAVDRDTRAVNISKIESCSNVSQDCNRVIDGLSPGTKYNITIYAISYGNENSQSCRLYGNSLPNSPLCSNVTTISNSSLRVFWRDGGNATDFRIAVDGDTRGVIISKIESCPNVSQDCNRVIDRLSPGTKHSITIFALSYGKENSQSCTLYGNSLPSPPKDCAIREVTAHNFTVSWTNGTGERDFYRVNYSCRSPNKPNETFTNYTKIKPVENIYKSIYLDPGTFCELQIYAVVGETETLSIPLVCNLSLHETAPGSVENLNILNITSTSMRISWTPPSKPNGLIRGYLLSVIENVGYCVEMQSCVQNYDFVIISKPENSSCQGLEQSIDNKTCLLNATTSNTTSNTGPFLLENLKPYVNYSIWLRAYTLCTGDNVIQNAMTLSTGPHQPSNINATAISPQDISVTWTSPDLCTGITSYSVIYTEAENSTVTRNTSCSDLRKDFGLTECTIGGLEEYWKYNISVQATVEGFLSNISSSVKETTLESVPGPVDTLELIPENNPNKSRSMLVKWNPPRPREKNGVILFYKITYYYKLLYVVEIVLASNESMILLENLTGGEIYFVNISANTSKGYGEVVQRNATIKSGAPEHPTIPLSKSTVQVSDPTRQIAVNLPVSSFLCNTEYGFVERQGVVVAQYSKATDVPFRGNASDFEGKLKSYRSWRDIRNDDIFPPYRATPNEWKPVEQCGSQARRKRSTGTGDLPDVVSFIIGNDTDCAGTSQHFCNGYLKPNSEYSVRVFVCTSEGCTESGWSSPIRTSQTESDNTAVIIALSVVLSLLFIFGILVIVVLRTRRMLCFKVKETLDPDIMLHDLELSLPGSKIKVHRPIQLSNLRMHIEDMHKDSNMKFSSEYKFIKEIEPKHTTDIAQSESCRSKNRYTNILPYDHSRVKLLPIEDEEGSDYINANYIQGYNSKREYIATQGPLPATRDDFWRMVWEQSAEIIVMLTKCMEKGRVKCDKYWPDVNEPVYYGDLIVNVTSESILCDYIIRVIEIKLNQTTKKVYHFSFLNWPDMGCPKDPLALLNFVTAVRTYVKPNFQSPIIVHCSAGVGRTGTFIAIDHLMQHVRDSVEIDIFNLVYEMRNQRSNMVQTEDQYVYIHDSILEYITEEDDDEDEEPIYENKPMDGEQIYENAAFLKD